MKMTRGQRFSILLLALLLTALVASACGGGAEPQADTPVPPAPTDTPVPPTPTPAPPTATPTPEPTPEPTPRAIDPSALSLPENLDTFILSQRESWKGAGPDGAPAAFQTDITVHFVREPQALYVSAVSDDPEAAQALQLVGSSDNSLELYFVGDQLYVPMMGSWMQIPVNVPGSMIQAEEVPFNPTNLMDEAFGEIGTVAQWLESAVYQGQDTVAGQSVDRYTFDESSFGLDRLPAGMVVEQAAGQLYVTAGDATLVGLEVTISGVNLVLDAERDQPTLSEGTVTYSFELSAINEPLTVNVPEQALQATRLPEDIPLPDDAQPGGVFNMMGMQFFSFLSKSPVEEIADFYRGAMPENGWTETEASGDEEYYSLTYTKDGRSLEISIIDEAQPGYTGIEITPSPAG